MNRFNVYLIGLGLNLLVFVLSIIFKFESFAGIINFVSFFTLIVYFLFSVEVPPLVEKLKIPEVHNYYRSRQNNYNNLLALEFGLISFLFFLLLSSTQLGISAIVILLWILSIPGTYYVILLNTRNSELEKVVDYIRFTKPGLFNSQTEAIIKSFIIKSTLQKDELMSVKGYDPTLLSELASVYILYVQNKDNALNKDEIEEINDL